MKKLTIFLLLFFFWIIVIFYQNAYSKDIKTSICSLMDSPLTTAQSQWLRDKFDYIVSDQGAVGMSAFSGYAWARYLDIGGTASAYDSTLLNDWAWGAGIDPEEVFLHSIVDYTYYANAWSGMDQFGKFENSTKGFFQETSPGVYADLTVRAYSGGGITCNKNFYLGYELPFDQANFTFTTPGVTTAGTWQYWNGTTWATLTATDGTSNLTVSGQLYFVPPADWSRHVVNGSRSKYWIRYLYTSAATPAIIGTVKGDPWYNDGVATHCRGWNGSSDTIVNSGELAYNPTPPANATAKFKYQSRMTFWSVNHFLTNPADYQMIGGSSTQTAAAYIAWRVLQFPSIVPYVNGVFLDDLPIGPNVVYNPYNTTDFYTKSGGSTDYLSYTNTRLTNVTSIVHATSPNFRVGGNSQLKAHVPLSDYTFHENYNYVNTGVADGVNTLLLTSDSTTINTFDDFLTANYNKPGMMSFSDVGNTTWKSGAAGKTYWDKSNRGPLVALAKYLIGANSNTYFGYFAPEGYGGIYSYVDDVYFLDPDKSTTLSANMSVDQTTGAKTISGVDFSLFPSGTSIVKIDGTNPEVFSVTKTNSTTLTINSPTVTFVNFSHSIGDRIRFATVRNQSDGVAYTNDNVLKWCNHFPAMDVNFGTGGTRNMSWALGTDYGWGSGTNNNVWSRDYTNALVLLRGNGGPQSTTDYDTYSVSLSLGGTYYPLKADGTTGSGITTIQLRREEGAILMKNPTGLPIDSDPPIITSANPYQTFPAGTTSATMEIHVSDYGSVAGCKYSSTDQAYASMPGSFSYISGDLWRATVSGLKSGNTYDEYVRCIDSLGNANSTSSHIQWNILSYVYGLTTPESGNSVIHLQDGSH